MKRFIRNIFILILFILPVSAFSISVTLKGIIEDACRAYGNNPVRSIKIMNDQLEEHEGYIAKPRSKWVGGGETPKGEYDIIYEAFNQKVDGNTPLYYAVVSGDLSLVRKMIKYGARINEPQGSNELSILFFAFLSEKGRKNDIIKALIEPEFSTFVRNQEGADCNWTFSYGDLKNCSAFIGACSTNDADIIRLVLNHTKKYDVRITSEKDNSSYTPFQYLLGDAAKYYEIILDLITNKNVDVLSMWQYGEARLSPLMLCSRQKYTKENAKIIDLLLERGANPNELCRLKNNDTIIEQAPIHKIARLGNAVVLKKFKDKNGDLNLKDSLGKTPLDYWGEYFSEQQNKTQADGLANLYLMKEKPSESYLSALPLNVKTTDDSQLNILHLALANKDEDSALKILEKALKTPLQKGKLSVWEEMDAKKETPVQYAFNFNQQNTINWFLENKIILKESEFFSAMENELKNSCNFFEFMKLDKKKEYKSFTKRLNTDKGLMICGPFVYAALFKGTSTETSISQSSRINMLTSLLEEGCDINERVSGSDFNGDTALIAASRNNEIEIVDFLLKQGADVNAKNSSNKTALFFALENKSEKLVDMILKTEKIVVSDIELKNKETLLMYFAKYGNFQQMKEILPKFVSENERCLSKTNNEGRTPFLYASVFNDDYRIMKLLRMYGADVFVKDKDGKNAHALAAENKNEKLLERLESWGVY